MNKQIVQIENYVHKKFKRDSTGHDFYHMRRVAKMAKHLAEDEPVDLFIVEVAGWLHDIGDKKLFENPKEELKELNLFLARIGVNESAIEAIHQAMKDVSFSKGEVPSTLEGKIVQDADRLDAIGAIGIARTFAFGGSKQRLIHSEDDHEIELASIQHFYDKLLHLKGLMNTKKASKIAEDRHKFMENFLEQFYAEWNTGELDKHI